MEFKTATKDTQFEARTENGMRASSSSLNNNVDMFFQIGAARGQDVTAMFERAYNENRLSALRIAAWARDVRGGAGEREIFRSLLKFVEKHHIDELAQLINVTPEFGRWDDLLVLESDLGRGIAFGLIKKTINAGIKAQALLGDIDSMSEDECQKILDTYN